MNKILAIVGPTASGKTAFALQIAKQVLLRDKYTGIDLISVDSRQVYQGLETLSGADVPENFKRVSDIRFKYSFFKMVDADIRLHGVSVLNLTDEWSVTHFKDFATQIVLDSFANKRLPILVGGTGLYHKHFFGRDKRLYIPPNKEIRTKANSMSLSELQHWLVKENYNKFNEMNNSDKNNPRRLIRAIEILLGEPKKQSQSILPEDILLTTIALKVNLDKTKEKIKLRVRNRFENGAVAEVKHLINEVSKDNDLPVFTSLGVVDILDFISGKVDKQVCIDNWSLHEFQYAKRQLTWFKKLPDVIWLDDLQKKQYTFR